MYPPRDFSVFRYFGTVYKSSMKCYNRGWRRRSEIRIVEYETLPSVSQRLCKCINAAPPPTRTGRRTYGGMSQQVHNPWLPASSSSYYSNILLLKLKCLQHLYYHYQILSRQPVWIKNVIWSTSNIFFDEFSYFYNQLFSLVLTCCCVQVAFFGTPFVCFEYYNCCSSIWSLPPSLLSPPLLPSPHLISLLLQGSTHVQVIERGRRWLVEGLAVVRK